MTIIFVICCRLLFWYLQSRIILQSRFWGKDFHLIFDVLSTWYKCSYNLLLLFLEQRSFGLEQIQVACTHTSESTRATSAYVFFKSRRDQEQRDNNKRLLLTHTQQPYHQHSSSSKKKFKFVNFWNNIQKNRRTPTITENKHKEKRKSPHTCTQFFSLYLFRSFFLSIFLLCL